MKNACNFALRMVERFIPGTVVGFALAVGVAANALGQPASRTVDLDRPGALAAVARERPDHFAKIQRILDAVPHRLLAGDSAATSMRTEFQAKDVRYSDIVMTSYPPKKRLEFSLDRTSYVTVVTLDIDAKPMPLK